MHILILTQNKKNYPHNVMNQCVAGYVIVKLPEGRHKDMAILSLLSKKIKPEMERIKEGDPKVFLNLESTNLPSWYAGMLRKLC